MNRMRSRTRSGRQCGKDEVSASQSSLALTLQFNHVFSIIAGTSRPRRTPHLKLSLILGRRSLPPLLVLLILVRILTVLTLPECLVGRKVHVHVKLLILLLRIVVRRLSFDRIGIAGLGGTESKNGKMLGGKDARGILYSGQLVVELTNLGAAGVGYGEARGIESECVGECAGFCVVVGV